MHPGPDIIYGELELSLIHISCPAFPKTPDTEEILMIRPLFCFNICLAMWRVQLNTPFKLVWITASKSSSDIFINRLSLVIPALFTSCLLYTSHCDHTRHLCCQNLISFPSLTFYQNLIIFYLCFNGICDLWTIHMLCDFWSYLCGITAVSYTHLPAGVAAQPSPKIFAMKFTEICLAASQSVGLSLIHI